MLKRFFISLLGTIAGIWISIGLFFFIGILIAVIAGSATDSDYIDIDKHSILHIKLEGEINERPAEISLVDEVYGNTMPQLALNNITAAIRAAADDSRIDGIYIDCRGTLAGITTRLDILQALQFFKKHSDKWIVAYADSYTQGDYLIASIADELYVNPVGNIDIHGLASTTYFYKKLLDKAGIDVQVIKVGTYKSAVEPFILSEISQANREQQELFIGQIWKTIAGEIAQNRSTAIEAVDQWADSLIFAENPETYTRCNLATALAYRHEVTESLKEKTNRGSDDLRLVTPAQYCSSTQLPHTSDTGNDIAVLYAVGDIVDIGDEGIVGPKVVRQIEELIKDKNNKGLVLRVNSGGGSAFASEQIWEALTRYKQTDRPLFVSMGDYAASGGYYISCCADRIYAQPTTLTGSIGIFGLIPCVEGLMTDHLGITQSTVATNSNADFISLTTPMNETQRKKMQQEINRGYETFVSRCATGRDITVDSIKTIAEGRVWDGKTALSIGLVDKLGNLDDAITAMADSLGFGDKYTVTEYPKLKLSFWDRLEELQNGTVKNRLLRQELGENYRMYRKIEQIKQMARIQARMDEIEVQ